MGIKVALLSFLIGLIIVVVNGDDDPGSARILKSENVLMKESYKFSYETSDGQTREEMGILMNPGTDDEELVVVGAYSYKNPDDEIVTVMYTADKRGYRPRVMTGGKKKQGKLSKNAVNSLVG